MFEQLPLLEGFSVTEIDGVVRRTLWSCLGVAMVAVAASIGLRYPLFGPGVVVGLALGATNNQVFTRSALRFTTEEGKVRRKVLGTNVAVRLGGVTAVAFALLFFVRPMGWGVLVGLIAFQILLLVNALKAVLAFQRTGPADG